MILPNFVLFYLIKGVWCTPTQKCLIFITGWPDLQMFFLRLNSKIWVFNTRLTATLMKVSMSVNYSFLRPSLDYFSIIIFVIFYLSHLYHPVLHFSSPHPPPPPPFTTSHPPRNSSLLCFLQPISSIYHLQSIVFFLTNEESLHISNFNIISLSSLSPFFHFTSPILWEACNTFREHRCNRLLHLGPYERNGQYVCQSYVCESVLGVCVCACTNIYLCMRMYVTI